MLVELKADEGPRDIRPGQIRGLQPLHFLLARSGLRGTRAGRKARDEFVQLRDLLFALGVLLLDARADGRFRQHHVVVSAVVHDHGLVIDVGRMRANAVEEMPVVRDDDQHAFVLAQIVLQPVHGIEVKIVGRLVEQQRRRIAEKRLRQQHAHFLAALQLAHLALVQRGFHIQPVEKQRGIGFRRVAAFFADDSFELAQAHAVGIGELVVRLGVERVALLQRLPERLVAHDHGVDHAVFVEGELVLPQDAELLRARDVPLDGSISPVRIFISVDFPAPLGPVMA